MERTECVCRIQNFGFASGQVISELRLHYTTLGAPQYDEAGQICNPVLLLHASNGSRRHWLTGPLGQGLFEGSLYLFKQRCTAGAGVYD